MKNQVTGHFVLNAKSEEAQSKVFIENGLEWEYSLDQEKETLKTTGPLYEAIVVLVSPSSTPPRPAGEGGAEEQMFWCSKDSDP